ncbi:hypothetical protein WIV_gp151 [Wiseana iridescent virus]|uniref:Uncharacterized protein n=1 Tax=Wiseana iridescent virus TaxID=68347 RepID=G0T5H7_IRV9|nr:hypothetical protein WIV_gp151 [Wiseana iridescent virus]ADO00495.1 hypothetical protein [Wiseana iridescent virus]
MNSLIPTNINFWYTVPKRELFLIVKFLTLVLVILSFFLPSNSIYFTLAISTVIGSGYYILNETYPRLVMLLTILVKYQISKLQTKILKVSRVLLTTPTKITPRLQSDENFNFLQYYDEDKVNPKKYILMVKKTLRSNDLIIFKDEFNQDITDHIEPYLGPMQNFHGSLITPGDFQHKKITVFRDGEINFFKTFEEDEPIRVQN